MTAGLLILISKGEEDEYFTYNPSITFFKFVYKQHTNFSMESIKQQFNIQPDFGNRVSCTISKHGDLIHKMYVVVSLPKINFFQENSDLTNLNKCAWTHNIGWNIIKSVELEIAGTVIDKQYGDWLYINHEISKKYISKNNDSFEQMIGNVPVLTELTNFKDDYTLYIPLNFWFCKYYGQSLPICALEFSDVKVNVEFSSLNDILILSPTNYIEIENSTTQFNSGDILYQSINNSISYIKFVYLENRTDNTNRLYYSKITQNPILSQTNDLQKYVYSIKSLDDKFYVYLKNSSSEQNHINKQKNFNWTKTLSIIDSFIYVDYIYLDFIERMKFITIPHTYLIETLSYDNDKLLSNSSSKIKMSYQNNCKEIFIRPQMNYLISNNLCQLNNYMLDYFQNIDIINEIQFIMNGQDRTTLRNSKYFNLIQPFQHNSNSLNGIYCYSFSLFPENFQPSGSCNLSEMSDVQFNIVVNKNINYNNYAKIRIYAICYKILKIENGRPYINLF